MTTQAVSNSERGCWTISHSGSIRPIQIFKFPKRSKSLFRGRVTWTSPIGIFIRRKFNKSKMTLICTRNAFKRFKWLWLTALDCYLFRVKPIGLILKISSLSIPVAFLGRVPFSNDLVGMNWYESVRWGEVQRFHDLEIGIIKKIKNTIGITYLNKPVAC